MGFKKGYKPLMTSEQKKQAKKSMGRKKEIEKRLNEKLKQGKEIKIVDFERLGYIGSILGFDTIKCGRKTKNNPNPYVIKDLQIMAKKVAKKYNEPLDVIEQATYKQLCEYLTLDKPIIIKNKPRKASGNVSFINIKISNILS